MRLLTVPNWSFGRNRRLLQAFRDTLEGSGLRVHYCAADVDHNRCVTAFSGEPEAVRKSLFGLCELAFPAIDLTRHIGVHPRLGALDVCPFVELAAKDNEFDSDQLVELAQFVESFARELAERYELPVFLYEKSERGRHEADLPSLRRGGFGGLIGKNLKPDFGPLQANPQLGVTVVGVRDFLIAVNVNLRGDDGKLARRIAKQIRHLRQEGDPRFLGVRALGFYLASRDLGQVSLNLTLPDLSPVDPIIDWIRDEARRAEKGVAGTQLVGVIRTRDLPTATWLKVRPEQIADGQPEDKKL